MTCATPTLTETAIGFRRWRLSDDRLVSIAAGEEWPVGDVRAQCRLKHAHLAPARDCSCGLYALHQPPYAPSEIDGHVWGVVAAWGQLQVHHDGFRAERMRALALIVDTAIARTAAMPAAARYGISVADTEAAILLGSEFGAIVPLEVRPDDTGLLLREILNAVTSRESVGTRYGPRLREAAVFLDVLVRHPNSSLPDAAQIATNFVAGVGPRPDKAQWDERLEAYRTALRREIAALDAGSPESGLEMDHLLYALKWVDGLTVTDIVNRLDHGLAVPAGLALHPQVIARAPEAVRPVARQALKASVRQRFLNADFAALALLDEFDHDLAICNALLGLRSNSGVEAVLNARPDLAVAVTGAILQSGRLILLTPQCTPHIAASRLRPLMASNAYLLADDQLGLREVVGLTTLEATAERLLRLSDNAVSTATAISLMPDPDRARDLIRPLARRVLGFTSDPTQLRERFWRCLSDSRLVALLDAETITAALCTPWIETRTRVQLVQAHRALADQFARQLWQRSDLDLHSARTLVAATSKTQPELVTSALDHADQTADRPRAALRLTAVMWEVLEPDQRMLATAGAVAADSRQPAQLRTVAAWRSAREGLRLPETHDPVLDRFDAYRRSDPNWRDRPQPPGPYGDFMLGD